MNSGTASRVLVNPPLENFKEETKEKEILFFFSFFFFSLFLFSAFWSNNLHELIMFFGALWRKCSREDGRRRRRRRQTAFLRGAKVDLFLFMRFTVIFDDVFQSAIDEFVLVFGLNHASSLLSQIDHRFFDIKFQRSIRVQLLKSDVDGQECACSSDPR